MSEITKSDVVGFEYPKQPIISYAQTHEDVLLWRALHSVGAGFYVDVGAHDPTALSVTRAFYDRGWRGINVEPSPMYAQMLRKERPRDVTFEVALGEKPGQATFYDFGTSGLSTLDKEIAESHLQVGLRPAEYQVSVTTLAALLGDLGNQEVHFLKIDAEGYERQIISGADFEKVRPWIVLIEATKPRTSIPSFGAWEPALLEAGYQFSYFDGLNRFYVSDEHAELKRYFCIPVNIADPYRDFEAVRLSDAVAARDSEVARLSDAIAARYGEVARLSDAVAARDSEVARLSTAVAALERDKMRHETPRLISDAHACDVRDAAGLLRIVEAQASDLLRLRRSLMSLHTPAESPHGVPPFEREVSVWARSVALADLARTQAAIADIIEQSRRWRRLGQLLGLVKQLDWETGRWQSNFINASDGAVPKGDRMPTPSMAALQSELERLTGLLADLRQSHWQRVGRWLGLTSRPASEESLSKSALLIEPFPDAAVQCLSAEANGRFLEECRAFAVDVILDVGANAGQFGQAIRTKGYRGHIISFEPLSDAHATLVAIADSDPLWDVAERCAVGGHDGWTEINIADNSRSSSLLPSLDPLCKAGPQTEYLGKESCRVITLDSYVERTFSDPTTLFAAKIATPGYEAEILAGLERNHGRVKVILCQLSIVPLYAGGLSMSEVCHLLGALNYRCVALGPELEDPTTGELLQVNGVFVKHD